MSPPRKVRRKRAILACLFPLGAVVVFTALAPACRKDGQMTGKMTGKMSERVHDLVIRGGRVMDPESGLDAIRDVGITAGKIAAISTATLTGRAVIDAHGLVVAPGFIDLHVHGQNPETYALRAADGVTTAL